MASLERRYDGRYRIIFCYAGKRYNHTLGKVSEKVARSSRERLEENLQFLERGLLEIPPAADLGLFLVTGGKLLAKPVVEKAMTLDEFFADYQARHPEGAKEANTRYTEDIHFQHILRILGKESVVRGITTPRLQTYIDRRSQEKGRRGEMLSHITVKKEIGTFTSVWNKWGVPQGHVAGPAPTKGLVYRKNKSKPPFQTWEQIERQIARGRLTESAKEALWESLFLSLAEVQDLLTHVQQTVRRKCIRAMFCLAAFTGARRSEILRSQLDDFDFEAGTITLREKKRDRSKDMTFRTVPMTTSLRAIMEEWLRDHPGGAITFCMKPNQPLKVQTAAKAFRAAVDGSKWSVLHGWHVLRHSFCSNCALKGLDQRVIDSWMGHQTEDMRQRYRHLFPNQERDAISMVFG